MADVNLTRLFPKKVKPVPTKGFPSFVERHGRPRRGLLRRAVYSAQETVDPRIVQRKMAEILSGEDLRSYVLLVNDKFYLLDGTHTFAAYLELGRIPRALIQRGKLRSY